ncbi:MAG: SUMF1/EgtB/PvdO family nonheme iron enzyme [Lewinellaceae bacterium]|nr:SUMF1/EgtB/PvdO family nonheme iron enzyme [Lewinellaceae bacterium]
MPQGANRVYRGGSWNNNADNCRCAYRNNWQPQNRNNNLGFRLVWVSPSAHGIVG